MLFIIFLIITLFDVSAQILVNSKPDSLQEQVNFYYNHINKHKKINLEKGIYFLIFDVSVNTDSVELSLNRKSKPPILYQKNNGYFTIICHEKSYPEFSFDYPNQQDVMKLFAKLYRIPENIIGSELPSAFEITDIYGNEFTKDSFRGYISIFFSSSNHDLFPIINEIKRNDYADPLKLVYIKKDLPVDLHNFKIEKGHDDIIFVSDYLFKLNPWTNDMTRKYPGAIVFISDDNTSLQYRNVLDFNYFKNDHDLKVEITELLQSIK